MYTEQEVIPDLYKTSSDIFATSTPTSTPTTTPKLPAEMQLYTEEAGNTGKSVLWVVCVIMALSSLAFYGMAMRVPVQKRLFHILTAFITTFAFLSYFAMATGDGVTAHTFKVVENKHHEVIKMYTREVYWARYVDWAITTPLLLADLCLLAGLNGASMTVAIVSDVIMILTGLFAAFPENNTQKWGWYLIACAAYLVIVYQLGYNGRFAVSNKDAKTKSFFSAIAGFTFLLWTVYPIVWGVADGSRIVNVDSEILVYAILDILAKPVFGFWLLTTHDSMSRTSPSIDGFWANGLSSEGTLRVGEDRD